MSLKNSAYAKSLFFFVALAAGFLLASTRDAYAACQASTYKGQSFRGMTVTSGFGARDQVATTNGNSTSSYHRALDLRVSDNPNVGAFYGGTVTHASNLGGWGNTVIVTNGNFQVQYGHAGSLNVSQGQQIQAGQNLGNWSQCSGNCTGPHLDAIYRVNVDGQWHNVDPMIADRLIQEGANPNSPEFAANALKATEENCGKSVPTKTMTPGSEDYKICQEDIQARVAQQMQAALTMRQNFENTYFTPPPQLSQIANTPCMSNELQRINRQFTGMLSSGLAGTGMFGGSAISQIMNNSFKGDVTNFNSSASILPGMMNFQSMASTALGGLLSNLGLGDAFSGQVCGLMLDMILKYIQCENPIKFPNLKDLFGNLNANLPSSCASKALSAGMSNMMMQQQQQPMAQTYQAPPATRTFDGTAFRRQ